MLKIKENNEACPTCKKGSVEYFPNKGHQQSLYQLKVRCTHQKEGCEWTGGLGDLDNHLNLDPQPAIQLEGCSYILIECRYHFAGCTVRLPRKEIPDHLEENTQRHFTLLEAKYNVMSRNLDRIKENIHSCFPTPPVTFTMKNYYRTLCNREELTMVDNFEPAWVSPPFYTHQFGYKMCLQVDLDLHSPLSLEVHLMKGEFDDKVKWHLLQ